MNRPKISIVTVCYNANDLLEDTIKSVLSQKYENIEYIIIDGGSTDGSTDVIRKFENHISFWISEPDKGIYDAMNKGMKYASGEYLFFLNAGDNFFNSMVLRDLAGDLDGHSIVYGNVMMHFSDHTEIYGGQFNRFRFTYENICHQSIFYPKTVYKNFKYDLKYPLLADWVGNMRMWRKHNFKFSPVTISNYYRGGLSDTTPDTQFTKDQKKIIFRNLGLLSILYVYIAIFKNKVRSSLKFFGFG